jgi:hypothetical protein
LQKTLHLQQNEQDMSQKLLFIGQTKSSFVAIDQQILVEKYEIVSFSLGSWKGKDFFGEIFRQFFWLWANIWDAKILYIWFSDYHTFLPCLFAKVFRKKCVIAIGGYDATALPEYQYGVYTNKWRGRISAFCCQLADVLVVDSQFLANELAQHTQNRFASKVKLSYLGRDFSDFYREEKIAKKQQIICVSGGSDMNRMYIKGVDRFVELAQKMPEIPFILVGLSGKALEHFAEIAPKNLQILGNQNLESLRILYNESALICQFSRFEAFGMVILEALLCECLPVSIKGIGPSEIIARTQGFVLEEWEIESAILLIQKAINQELSQNEELKNSIMEHFSLERRKKELYSFLDF